MAAKGKNTNRKAPGSKPVVKQQVKPKEPDRVSVETETFDDEIPLGNDSDSEEEGYSEDVDDIEDVDESENDDDEDEDESEVDKDVDEEEEVEDEYEEFAGFDSDPDNYDQVEDTEEDKEQKSTPQLKLSSEAENEIRSKIAKSKKSSAEKDVESSTNSTKKSKSSDNEEKPGVLYIGRIPHGFYESQMRRYFSQFGDILRLRLSRNKKTGASKHYAFIEFASSEVAQIVADTMNNYLLYGHILKVSVVPENQVHEKMFVGSNRKFKRIPRAKMAKQQHDRKRNNEQLEKLVARENKRRKNKQERLKELGIDYTLPTPEVKSH
ncbi:hypothetical protein POJ06DRAFT_297691 [Lipomyces tetrasporus]|uniref:RRM domain-containing protein n=1 Tax=Lipomyces tetrasporus TaxID=54092 RepID=A0AAD7QK68_9ASCO|nr:uncharacterized protein POJ06DRAFT_297691 [Lipomyces tetrasporus]KAJ8096721.1 hypothetical protein POJ06DRAFT_297691 [Lipomyces tetrasporus]